MTSVGARTWWKTSETKRDALFVIRSAITAPSNYSIHHVLQSVRLVNAEGTVMFIKSYVYRSDWT